MTMQSFPTKAQVDQAAPLDFDAPRSERQCNITVELAPDGLHVRAEYTGALSSISQVIERLKALGVVELVSASKPAVAPAEKRTKAERVEPIYQPDGTACCPIHKRALSEGSYGLYCSAKAKPGDVQNAKGYCGLKFLD